MDSDRISAIPMLPMEPAKAVRIVRPFFVSRLFRLRPRAVKKDMDVFFCVSGTGADSVSGSNGAESEMICPSSRRTVREA